MNLIIEPSQRFSVLRVFQDGFVNTWNTFSSLEIAMDAVDREDWTRFTIGGRIVDFVIIIDRSSDIGVRKVGKIKPPAKKVEVTWSQG